MLLGVIEDDLRIFLFLESLARDLVAGADQASHDRVVADDLM